MPIYNYNCEDCNKEFEVLTTNNKSGVECTSCGSKNVKKIFSSFDFNIKRSSSSGCGSGGCCGI